MDADGTAPRRIRPRDQTLLHRELTRRVIGEFFAVYNDLRGGFLEAVYAGALEIALTGAGLRVDREVPLPVWFRGRRVADYRADFLVESVLMLEVKAVRRLDEIHAAQLLNYLRATDVEVGLLFNFGPRPQFQRLVLENRRKPIRVHQRRSAVPPPFDGQDEA